MESDERCTTKTGNAKIIDPSDYNFDEGMGGLDMLQGVYKITFAGVILPEEPDSYVLKSYANTTYAQISTLSNNYYTKTERENKYALNMSIPNM